MITLSTSVYTSLNYLHANSVMYAHYHLFRSTFQVKPQVDKMNAIAYGMYKTSLNDSGYAMIINCMIIVVGILSVHY